MVCWKDNDNFVSRHPNIKFTMETKVSTVIPFFVVLIQNCNKILNTTTYHKLTYPALLLNFNSFTSRFYKVSLIKCLIDCAYKKIHELVFIIMKPKSKKL